MSPTKPKRRWYQFSLRTLMLFVLLCAVPCSWFAVKMRQAREQREAVAAIVKADGQVKYDYEQRVDAFIRAAPPPEPPAPAWLLKLLGVDFFADVIAVESLGRKFGDREYDALEETD